MRASPLLFGGIHVPLSKSGTEQMAEHMLPALQFHPLADLFPLLEGLDFEELVADVRAHGVREPVWIHDSRILDGRNRYRAAQAADVECPTRTYDGDDPVGFVISLNLKRRHLSESQRAMVAAKLANLKDGQRADLVEGLPIGRASGLLNVGERTVARAREVREHGVPELVEAVERGTVSVAAAADIASQPLEQQHQIVARGEREILEAAKAIRAKNMEERRSERIARLAAISNCDAPLPQDRKYPVILADPPWKFEVYDAESGLDSAAEAHYPCMATEEIAALPVGDLATRPAVLFLWTTAPHLPEVFGVLEAWGFQYVTHVVWVKDRAGLGFWVRNQHELLIIARCGDMPTPAFENRPSSVIAAACREHSRKPDEAYALIERMYPNLPKIELFARSWRPGWDAWGNEAPSHPLDIPPCLRRVAP